ncbi:MAG TPA: transglutaminase-like domain-containing protein [Candidatus Borkfalkia stercoripullorum]|nr:transglutaminase-like domain-containing protein [Candidatus Borkfalkia stercoripullorum]
MTVTADRKKRIIIIGAAAAAVTVLLAVLLGLFAGGFGSGKPKLVFSSGDESFLYDGQAHRGSEWQLIGGSLEEGYTVSAEFTQEQTQAGKYVNSFTAYVYDENGNDARGSYEIVYEFGTLEIQPREIVLSTPDAKKEYDGTPLTSGGYEVVAEDLLEGHSVQVEVTGSRTETGESPNAAEVTVTDAGGNDVTANYAVTVREGTLTVTPVAVTVMTYSDMKVYDGEPLDCPEYTVSGLWEGDTFSADLPAWQTDVGQCENIVADYAVRDREGNDVTGRYEFTFHYGELTVTPRIIAVRSGDASKQYDGEPLTCPEWEIVSITQPVQGHIASAVVTGTITEVGQVPNTIAQVQVADGSGRDVTFNYEVKTEEGRLVVKGESAGGDPGGDPGGIAGTGGGDLSSDGSLGGGMLEGGAGGESAVALRVLSDVGGRVYLRLKSFGDYDYNGWKEAAPYGGRIDGKYSLNYMSGIALREAGVSRAHMSIEVAGGDYLLPYYLDASELDYRVQESDVLYEGDTGSAYSVYYYPYDYVSSGLPAVDLGEYAGEESAYAAYVKQHYLAVPASTRQYMDTLIAEQGFDKNDPYILSEVAEYIRGAAEYDLQYDRALDGEEDVAVAFLQTYKEGICQHYASAATLLLRSLGIPARYTIGYAGEAAAGEWTEIAAKNAHAWVEAYIDGLGWVYIEVTGGGPASGFGGTDGSGGSGESGSGGSGESGSGEGGSGEGGSGTLIELNIKPVDEYMKYDGVSTLVHSGTLQGLTRLTERGYTYEAEVSGSRRDVGITVCEIVSFRLYDPSGAEVTDRFDITCSSGKLQMYLREITVVTADAYKVYDGTPLTGTECSLEGSLLYGQTVRTLSATGSVTNVGRSVNTFKIAITDAEGHDVTYMYKVNADYGVLEVAPREIAITAGSAEKVYDGAPLVCADYEIDSEYGEALAEGHTVQVTLSGVQTEIGQSENQVSFYKITDAAGNDVTSNYSVRLVGGTLRVTR